MKRTRTRNRVQIYCILEILCPHSGFVISTAIFSMRVANGRHAKSNYHMCLSSMAEKLNVERKFWAEIRIVTCIIGGNRPFLTNISQFIPTTATFDHIKFYSKAQYETYCESYTTMIRLVQYKSQYDFVH